MQCDDVIGQLAASGGSLDLADRRARRHAEACLRCQAELVQYRKLLRALHSLRTQVLEPAPGLVADVLAGIEARGERHAVRSLVRGRRAAYVGGLAVATAAGAAGAIVLASRSRGRKLRLAG